MPVHGVGILYNDIHQLRNSMKKSFNSGAATDKQRRRIRRNISAAPRNSVHLETSLEDAFMINEKTEKSDGVIFGVYGADEWVTSSHIRKSVESGQNTLTMEGIWITPAGWSLADWVDTKAKRFNFMSMNRALLFPEWGIVEATVSRGKLELELNGTPSEVHRFIKQLDGELKRAENLIEWIYSARGDSISVPLNYRPAVKGAYPWLPNEIGSYVDDYMNSEASVLILIGPPGTGKTSFIKSLIHRSGGNAKVTYDEAVMAGDSLFANFIESETKFLIMEDADAFLAKREDGNTMMHRFLNVSDGLISAKDKKLVFSTNLPSVRDIDQALLRPGRCFDIIEFRALTRAEAQVVATEVGLVLPDGAEFTLAELFNVQPSGEAKSLGRRVGFV